GGGLLAYGVMTGANNSGKDYSTDIKKEADRLNAQRNSVPPPSKEKKEEAKIKPFDPLWKTDQPLAYHAAPWFWLVESAKSRRRMPRVLPLAETTDPDKARVTTLPFGVSVVSENEQIQVDYLAAGLKSYESHGADFTKKKFLGFALGDKKDSDVKK